MIRWVREHQWLPEVLLAASLFTIFGGLDLASNGAIALVPAALFSATVLFIRRASYLSAILLVAALSAQLFFELVLTYSSLDALLAVFLQAAFASLIWRQITVITANAIGLVNLWVLVFINGLQTINGLTAYSDSAKWTVFGFLAILLVSLNTLAWIFGRLLITRLTHVGTNNDRAQLIHNQARLSIEVARQTERLGIARDLTDLLVQRISAVVSLVQGAEYTAKLDSDSALRALGKISESSSGAQTELRRLYDMLHEDHKLTAAPPRIEDLEPLIISMRELGYNASLAIDGEPFAINEGAELCIFKIVFEALENVKKNTVLGTSVTVNFFWTESGLQVLIKDNGIETENRNDDTSGALEGYTVSEDLKSLVESVDGATLRVLRERAALYEGSIEATRVPGVGFTLSAIFPHLKTIAGN